MKIDLSWSNFKTQVVDKLNVRYSDRDAFYIVDYMDAAGGIECSILKDSGEDQTDFETNYKDAANKGVKSSTSVLSVPPFGSKTVEIEGDIKNLSARYTGVQQALTTGSNTIDLTIPYPWVKIIGIELINGEALDYADFKVFDDSDGTYSGTPDAMLSQFAYSMNVGPVFYQKVSQFDADLYYGMILRLTYNSVSAKTVGLNILMNEVVS